MCSIAGGNFPQNIVQNVSDSMSHRGVDGKGIFSDSHISLAHNRLSIIDLDMRASQPMCKPLISENLVIVFNGEIYNYLELKAELREFNFATTSDTEVILASFVKWGESCLSHFNGDFAFVIYDKVAKTIFCARDRLGNKPFYYYLQGDKFLFASELHALQDELKCPINVQKLGDSVLFSAFDDGCETIFSGIKMLSQAHFMKIDLNNFKSEIKRYWEVLPCVRAKDGFNTKDFENKKEELESLLLDSTRLRLIADVDVAMLISGGIDSSVLVFLALKNSKKVKFFSSQFPNHKESDESEFVEILSQDSGLKPHYIYPSEANLLPDLENLIKTQNYIFGGLSVYSQYCVMQEVAKHSKVVLSGQGADELFGGYGSYIDRILVENPLEIFRRARIYKEESIIQHIKNALIVRKGWAKKREDFKFIYDGKLDFILPNYKPNFDYIIYRHITRTSELLRLETTHYNLPCLLRYEDRNAMAFGVENRSPFTDYKVVEFAHSLPLSYRFHNGYSKYILRSILDKYSKKLAWRLDKKGFEAPNKAWLSMLGVKDNDEFKIYLAKKILAKN